MHKNRGAFDPLAILEIERNWEKGLKDEIRFPCLWYFTMYVCLLLEKYVYIF